MSDHTRQRWLAWVHRLADPVLEAAAAGRLRTTLAPEHHPDCQPGRLASSHLEAVGRLLLGLGPWLGLSGGSEEEAAYRQRLASAARAAIVHGCTPGHPDWFGHDHEQQPIVDMAFLASALVSGRSALWDPLTPGQRCLILDAFATLRGRKPAFNNWLLFAASAEAFCKEVGAFWDPMRVDYALRQHEQWYLGDGLYGDGPHHHWDWYNSYVIQPLLESVLRTCADADQAWTDLLPRIRRRLARFAAVQERMVAPDGSFPPIGRSLAYRCGAFQALAHAAWRGLLPDDLPPGQVRSALTAVCARTLDAPGNWRIDGFLRIGLNGAQPGLGESYITTGSLLLASAAFLPLGLPAEHPFWTEPEMPWTSRRIFDLGENLPADHAIRD